jgi:hypothetical protein
MATTQLCQLTRPVPTRIVCVAVARCTRIRNTSSFTRFAIYTRTRRSRLARTGHTTRSHITIPSTSNRRTLRPIQAILRTSMPTEDIRIANCAVPPCDRNIHKNCRENEKNKTCSDHKYFSFALNSICKLQHNSVSLEHE